MKHVTALLLISLVFSSQSVADEWFNSGPKSYDDCILKSMKGINSDRAATLIARSCLKKFPRNAEKKDKSRLLTKEELAKVGGKAQANVYVDSASFEGDIYNGNNNLIIDELIIGVVAKAGKISNTREYKVSKTVNPLSSKSFLITIIKESDGSNYSWHLIEARGHAD